MLIYVPESLVKKTLEALREAGLLLKSPVHKARVDPPDETGSDLTFDNPLTEGLVLRKTPVVSLQTGEPGGEE